MGVRQGDSGLAAPLAAHACCSLPQGFGWAIAKALAEAGAEISLGVWVSCARSGSAAAAVPACMLARCRRRGSAWQQRPGLCSGPESVMGASRASMCVRTQQPGALLVRHERSSCDETPGRQHEGGGGKPNLSRREQQWAAPAAALDCASQQQLAAAPAWRDEATFVPPLCADSHHATQHTTNKQTNRSPHSTSLRRASGVASLMRRASWPTAACLTSPTSTPWTPCSTRQRTCQRRCVVCLMAMVSAGGCEQALCLTRQRTCQRRWGDGATSRDLEGCILAGG